MSNPWNDPDFRRIGLAYRWEAVTPDTDLADVGIAIRTTGAGDVTYTDATEAVVTIPMADFDTLATSVTRISSTSTASGIFVGFVE